MNNKGSGVALKTENDKAAEMENENNELSSKEEALVALEANGEWVYELCERFIYILN